VDPVLRVPHEEGRVAFLEALDHFLGAVEPLDDHALLGASRCWGWTVVDVVTHVRLGLEEVAACLLSAGASSAVPHLDAATYWLAHPPADPAEELAGLLAIRRVASATRAPSTSVTLLRQVTRGLRWTVGRLPEGVVELQGGVLATGDLYATWAVELAVHQLDLARDVDVAPPTTVALGLARRTVDALAATGLAVPAFAGRLPAS
jgi:hypothetical protein